MRTATVKLPSCSTVDEETIRDSFLGLLRCGHDVSYRYTTQERVVGIPRKNLVREYTMTRNSYERV